jgi:hypothetical protein
MASPGVRTGGNPKAPNVVISAIALSWDGKTPSRPRYGQGAGLGISFATTTAATARTSFNALRASGSRRS